MKEYYSRLFLHDGASRAEVKTAYYKLVKKFHPDKNLESDEYVSEFRLIKEAYDKLMDYFDQKESKSKKNEDDLNYNKESYSKSEPETGIVKSKSRYAEAVIGEPNEIVFRLVIGSLILVFIFCLLYAIVDKVKEFI